MRAAISGTSGGLGAALSVALTGLGVDVVGCGSRPDGTRHERVDVTVGADVQDWARRSAALGGPFHLVVANAALALETKPALAVSDAEFLRVMQVNVLGVFTMFTAFAPYAADDCVFVAMSSRWGRSAPRAGQAAYCASKFAVEGLVAAWRHEIRPGQRVYAVDPGAGIGTPMMRRMTPPDTWADPPVPPGDWAARAAPFLCGLTRQPQGPSPVRVPLH